MSPALCSGGRRSAQEGSGSWEWQGWVTSPYPLLHTQPPPHSLTGEERRSNSPHPAFQTGATVLVKPRISMEIETSFFRGPLLTSPSASVLENQSLGCALRTDDPFILSPDRWQLRERLCWTLLPQCPTCGPSWTFSAGLDA